MAEEFTLDQTLRDRGRIDSDEGSIPSLTQFMDSSSDDLLTRSTLTGYDSEGITGSECLDHSEKLAHCSTLPDERSYSAPTLDRKSTRLNSSHVAISYAVFCLQTQTG